MRTKNTLLIVPTEIPYSLKNERVLISISEAEFDTELTSIDLRGRISVAYSGTPSDIIRINDDL